MRRRSLRSREPPALDSRERHYAALDQPASRRSSAVSVLFDFTIAAFVVRNPISRKFVFRAQFDVDLTPFGFAVCDAADCLGDWLVSENVSIADSLPDSPNDAAVIQTIITLSHSLGLSVIAEGVETEAQRQFLERHGCPIYQGNLFSAPVAPAVFEQLLMRG